MQVDTCHFQRRRGGKPGLPLFRNIISFPQELLEIKQLHHFFSNLSPNDVVNCTVALAGDTIPRDYRARFLSRTDDGWLVEFHDGGEALEIQTSCISRRVQLPWKPADLRDYLIIFRRRNAGKDEYIEDLKVRRAFVENLLQIFTRLDAWRPDEPIGPMHQYYTGFDLLQSDVISDFLPENDVPEGLHFQDFDAGDSDDRRITRMEFTEWLQEGKNDCNVAQCLLVAWTRFLAKSDNESLSDLFLHLFDEEHDRGSDERAESDGHAKEQPKTLSVRFLAEFVRKQCVLTFQVHSEDEHDILEEITEHILQELASVHAYLGTWRTSGGFTDYAGTKDVGTELRTEVEDVVLPWPTIERVPVREDDDARLVKSFPIEFPMGQGDLHQPRLRSDFSAADYVQHKFRYFDARFLDSARGQRVAWALFNTALREQSRQTGHLVHKNSSEKALTLQELRDLVNSREDLVRKVATFGAEIPTTPMHWKKEGNHLEWIVRQMSWFPPWCFSDVHDARVAESTRQRAKKEVAAIDGVKSEIHEAGRATEEDVKEKYSAEVVRA